MSYTKSICPTLKYVQKVFNKYIQDGESTGKQKKPIAAVSFIFPACLNCTLQLLSAETHHMRLWKPFISAYLLISLELKYSFPPASSLSSPPASSLSSP